MDRDRRRFLIRCTLLGCVPAIARCAGGAPDGDAIASRAATYDPGLVCDDVAGLWPVEVATRTDNQYTPASAEPDRYCFNCSNFIAPATPGGCGSCRTVKGPIHPLGWCKSWTEKKG